jgi:hypothetical protein
VRAKKKSGCERCGKGEAKQKYVPTHIGHSAWAWAVRGHPCMAAVGAAVAGTADLRVGL